MEEKSLLSALRGLATLEPVSRDAAEMAAAELRATQTDLERLQGTDAARARETAELLDAALAYHTHNETTDCRVCGSKGALTFTWANSTREEVERLRKEAADADAANHRATAARRRAQQLLVPLPRAAGPDADVTGVDLTELRARWAAFATPPEDALLAGLAKHLETETPPLVATVAAVRAAATAELERREDRWRPVGQRVAAWLPTARRAVEARERVTRLKAAEGWLREAHDAIRDARFAPIADAVQANWSALRRDSNVELQMLRLAGAATNRRLVLDVNVDGTESAALSVMSQGELNCLALSLFLPRASMAESPFRFLVIDDPVQAMDPAKVEGLARVLDDVAKDRQVVVFTHDDRLPEMVRRLEMNATVVEVTRRQGSVVELRAVADPVQRHIDDAMALTYETIPPAAARAIPGLCRIAVETACQRAVTRTLLAAGTSHAEIDRALAGPKTVKSWLALWLFGDATRAGDVMTSLNNRGMGDEATAARWCAEATHSASERDAKTMVRAAEKLTRVIQKR